jgi:serine/threonine-protein kinase
MSELVGRKLGKYTLEAKLGEGGMAAVFQSRHPQFDRPVAIKILPPTVDQDPNFRARFEREGRTIAGLNHPNIIRIYDIDESDGLFYMVMDLLPAGTLESRIRAGGLDRTWGVDVIAKVAEALEYAHVRGVIHRDIKPSNILLDADDQPVLADFGIARLALSESDANLTAAGTVMGTPAYMAPEQLTGGQPDARSDIYSLGVVLYQLLTGRAPFTGDTMAVVTAHLTKPPPPPRDLVQDLPPALDAVVLQALAKQPEHRFKSAGVFAQALRSAAADLEPGLVRVVSAARMVAAPTFSGAALPQSGALPQAPESTGQKVARFLPIVLGVLGLLLLISIVIRNWALFALLAMLFGGGGFLFLYLRASKQGRTAARETTRAITTATIITPPKPSTRETLVLDDRDDLQSPLPSPPEAVAAAVAAPPRARETLILDDVAEFPLPDDPTQALETSADDAANLPTAALPAQPDSLPATEAVPAQPEEASQAAVILATDDLPPTEALPAQSHDSPTEAVPAQPDPLPATEAVPTSQPGEQS